MQRFRYKAAGWKLTSAAAIPSGTVSITWFGCYGVLGGEVGTRCREILRETARAHEMVIHAGHSPKHFLQLMLSLMFVRCFR